MVTDLSSFGCQRYGEIIETESVLLLLASITTTLVRINIIHTS